MDGLRSTRILSSDDEAVGIWIHEIGHLRGLKHHPGAESHTAGLSSQLLYIVHNIKLGDPVALQVERDDKLQYLAFEME